MKYHILDSTTSDEDKKQLVDKVKATSLKPNMRDINEEGKYHIYMIDDDTVKGYGVISNNHIIKYESTDGSADVRELLRLLRLKQQLKQYI